MQPTRWSYSAYATYSKCARQYKYSYVDKLPRTPHPSAERGIRVHKACEDYLLRKTHRVPDEAKRYADQLRALSEHTHIAPEYAIYLTPEWTPAPKEQRYFTAFLDTVAILDNDEGLVVDFKTGRPYDSHAVQMDLYALALRADIPTLKNIHTELYYLDYDMPIVKDVHTPHADDQLRRMWSNRASKMLNDTEYTPTPGRHCNWCDFNAKSGGPCTAGI